MSPITKRENAVEPNGGFKQVRDNLTKFSMNVQSAEFGIYSGGQNDDGTPKKPQEYLEIYGTDVVIIASDEPIEMDISAGYSFRIKCSDYKNSFWVEKFLVSAEAFQLLIPDDLIGNNITFERTVLEAFDRAGTPTPQYNSTGYIITDVAKIEAPVEAAPADPKDIAVSLAIGKTEQEFKNSIVLHPAFTSDASLLSMARSGALVASLISEGRLVVVDGKYSMP